MTVSVSSVETVPPAEGVAEGKQQCDRPYRVGRPQGLPGGVQREATRGRVQEGFWKLHTGTEKPAGLTMGPFVLKPMTPNPDLIPDLIAVSAFPETVLTSLGLSGQAPVRQSVLWALSTPPLPPQPPEEEEIHMLKPLAVP